MDLDQMIEVLQAAKRGEKIEVLTHDQWVEIEAGKSFDFYYKHRIAPKPQMTLVEEARAASTCGDGLFSRLADRIEELEKAFQITVKDFTTDELLAELKRRTSC